jgi:hypothetical protein
VSINIKAMKKYVHPFQIVPWFVLFSILGCTIAWGQDYRTHHKRVFLRIYGHDGSILSKGRLLHVMDSSLVLASMKEGKSKMDSIHFTSISFIRTGKSPMSSFAKGGMIAFAVVTPMIALAETSANVTLTTINTIAGAQPPEPESQAIRNGFIAGITVGTACALVRAASQKKMTIDGSFEKFKSVSQVWKLY